MTTRLTFDLSTVCQLAEHAAAATGTDDTDTGHPGPALLLQSGSNGIWLTSNSPHPQPAPAHQPGTLDRQAAFAQQCPPGTPWPEQVRLLRTEIPLMHVVPLNEPTSDPLLHRLRAAQLAGATTLRVLLSDTGLDVAVVRRRERSTARNPHRGGRSVDAGTEPTRAHPTAAGAEGRLAHG